MKGDFGDHASYGNIIRQYYKRVMHSLVSAVEVRLKPRRRHVIAGSGMDLHASRLAPLESSRHRSNILKGQSPAIARAFLFRYSSLKESFFGT